MYYLYSIEDPSVVDMLILALCSELLIFIKAFLELHSLDSELEFGDAVLSRGKARTNPYSTLIALTAASNLVS